MSRPIVNPSRPTRRAGARALIGLAFAVALAACGSDTVDSPSAGTPPVTSADDAGTGAGSGETPAPAIVAGAFALDLPEAAQPLSEGGEGATLRVGVTRSEGYSGPVTLAVEEPGAADGGFVWRFADTTLEAEQSETTLAVTLPIGARPRQPGTRTLRVVASGPGGIRASAEVVFAVEPTARPDIYLIAGQSNAIGSTRPGARRAGPGEPDAPDPRILQLDVTPNDQRRFPSPASFTDIDAIAAPDQRIVEALDPLHDIRDRGKNTKSGTTIGLGLSFAKAALADTAAEIVLVPSGWSDTGFCRRESNRYPGMGWNATEPVSPVFAGTLLHDRAIARTNLAITETGGILRGILWHQGEADSADPECAARYAENLAAMVASFRTNIVADARGAAARGADADIPFIVGTMATGDDERGPALAPFGPIKSIVDSAHRNVAGAVPFSDFVNADDLVPPSYRCGQGFCIHFGAEALRELGTRYYERLRGLFDER